MALESDVHKQLPSKTNTKKPVQRKRKKIVRRRKKATGAGPDSPAPRREAETDAKAVTMTQLDVGEIRQPSSGAEPPTPVDAAAKGTQQTTGAAGDKTRKATPPNKAEKASKPKTRKRASRPRSRKKAAQPAAGVQPAPATAIEPAPASFNGTATTQGTGAAPRVLVEPTPDKRPEEAGKPQGRRSRGRRTVTRDRPRPSTSPPTDTVAEKPDTGVVAAQAPDAAARTANTGVGAAVLEGAPPAAASHDHARDNRETGVTAVDVPQTAREARRPRRTRSGRPRRGRGQGQRGEKAAEPLPQAREALPVTGADTETSEERAGISRLRIGREMVINVSAEDECRIAVLEDGRLEELFIERASTQSHVGNIYKGRVTNVEPSIQAVFVDFGLAKNGFLHISDVQPQYFPDHTGEPEDVGRKIPRHSRPPIQKCFRRGQELIVQVTKEGVGTKGPTLTTYLSIPGRFLVMMPGMNRQGVSRKIEDEAERRKMRDVLKELKLPSGMGFILRTAGLGQSKRELQRDLNYLLRLWKRVVERIKKLPAPTELYQESDLVKRTVRDVYTGDFARLIVDCPETATKAREFLQIAMPRSKAAIEVYSDREPLFHRLGIEEEIDRIHMRHVPLPSGGSIVIDSTEALVAIDVNSGRFRSVDDAEESAYRINLEAVDEIARQLRLRDLGGLIVCDFIDMRHDRHQRGVERAMREAVKKHKERARVLRMSQFGLIEMTRQRQGPSYKRNVFFDCPHCKGAGVVKMPESVMLDVMRFIQLATHNPQVRVVKVAVATDVAFQILNNKRGMITQIEEATDKQVLIRGDSSFTSDQIEYICEDLRGRPVTVGRATATTVGNREPESRNASRRSR